MTFKELQELLKNELGINHLADIARELNVTPQAVSNWKARDRVPYKYIKKIRAQRLTTINNKKLDSENLVEIEKRVYENNLIKSSLDDPISIIDVFLILARQLKIILIIPLIFCLFTIVYSLFFVNPVYESSAKIMSSSPSSNPSQAAGIAAQFGINLPTGQSDPEWVYPEVVKSRTIARSMLKRKFDTEKFGQQKTLLQILSNIDNISNPDMEAHIKNAVDNVIGMININKNGSFYDLTIKASEPNFARDFAVALIQELDSHQRDYNKKKTSKTRKFIEERIESTRKELENAEESLKDFNDRNRRIENSPALQLERQRLSRETAVLTGVFTTLKQQLETTKIEEVKESEYVIVLDPPEAPLYRSKPKRKRMVLISFILGLGIGIIIAFIKEFLDRAEKVNREKIFKVKSLLIKNILDLITLSKNK